MKTKKLVALMLVGGLVFGGVTVADAKKKKKKPRKVVKEVPTPVTLYLRQLSDNCQTGSQEALMAEPSTADLECYGIDNFLQEPAAAILGDYLYNEYAASEGVPFVLDASKAVVGKVTVRSGDDAGAGLAELTVILVGETGGEEKILGTYATEYQATPTEVYTFDYEMDVDDTLNKLTFDTLTLKVAAHGYAVNHGQIELDDPASFITVPTIVKKTVIKK